MDNGQSNSQQECLLLLTAGLMGFGRRPTLRRPQSGGLPRRWTLAGPTGLAEGLQQLSQTPTVGSPGQHVHNRVQSEVQGHENVCNPIEWMGFSVRMHLGHYDGDLFKKKEKEKVSYCET